MNKDKKKAEDIGQADSTGQLWLENVYQTYYKKVYNYLFYRLLDRDAAEEVTSSAFIRIVEKRHLYQEEKAQISTWIFTIAKNELINHYRKRKPLQAWDETAAGLESCQNIEEALIKEDEKRRFLAALRTLPERERSMIAMKYYFDMSYEEIAGQTALTAKNVSVILTRAKARLRSLCLDNEL